MRKGIVRAFLLLLVGACWGLAQDPSPVGGADSSLILPLPPSDPRLPMPPMPAIPQPPTQTDVTKSAASNAPPSNPHSDRTVPAKNPYLELPPLPPVPKPLPLPDSILNNPVSARPMTPGELANQPTPIIPAVYQKSATSGSDIPPPDPIRRTSYEAPRELPLPTITTTPSNDVKPTTPVVQTLPGTLVPAPPGTRRPTPTAPITSRVAPAQPAPSENPATPENPAGPFWEADGQQNWNYRRRWLPPSVDSEPRFWANVEYLLWFYPEAASPPLLMTVPAAAVSSRFNPSTATVLFPNEPLNDGPASGMRFNAGMWLDLNRRWGIEGSYFWLPQQTTSEEFGSGDTQILGRPFFNTATNRPALLPLSSPRFVAGNSTVSSGIDLQGGEINGLYRYGRELWFDIAFIGGFRYIGMTERLGIRDHWEAPAFGAQLSSFDEFRTSNQFFGGQLGFKVGYTAERWRADVAFKFAYGAMQQSVFVDGGTRAVLPALGERSVAGGTLTQPTNLGTWSRTIDTWAPEFTLNLGYRVSNGITAYIGYNFLFVNDVARPGRQIDTSVNPDFLPFTNPTGASQAQRPSITGQNDSFWAQGLNFGFAFSY